MRTSLTLPLPHVQARRASTLAEVAALVALLAAAVPMRLVNLDAAASRFDEGIRGGQLLLMAHGFRPFRDIFASQGPLSLEVFYPTFILFGQTLEAARLAPALLSLVGLVLVAWTARLVGGALAATCAAIILLLSPTYLKNSRLALVEIPAIVPAIAAIGAAMVYQQGGGRRWLVASGALFGLALLVKPIVLPAAVPIGLLILTRGHGWLRAGLLFGGVCAAVIAAVVALVGPVEVYDQMVRFRAASRQAEGWSLKENWAAMVGELADEQLPLYVAATLSGLLLLLARPRVGLALVAWPIATFGLLMVYSPLQFKHAVIMLPPLALLVGAGAGECWSRARNRERRTARRTLHPPAQIDQNAQNSSERRIQGTSWLFLAVALGYALSLPAILRLDQRIVAGLTENRPESYGDEIGLVQTLSGPGDFVLVDEPSVAFAARRLVPPSLVDTSALRVRSRSLGANDVIGAVEQYDVRLLFLFSDGLRSIRRFGEWVDERYVPITINERRNGKDRALYLRRDADLEGARAALERTLVTDSAATFGGQLRLLGHALERGDVRPGGSLEVTLGWQSLGPIAADYHVLTVLRDAGGQVVEQNERGLGGGSAGTAAWEAGRWVFRGSTLALRGVEPGEYRLAVSLYDSRARQMLPLDGASVTEAPLATVRVRA
ncbi:MAG: glycosyltransferase family 39 protein [Chloroflexi bacterium]|nr:glycosyltransferase family 39 protein [Chloroflexota bacterium]